MVKGLLVGLVIGGAIALGAYALVHVRPDILDAWNTWLRSRAQSPAPVAAAPPPPPEVGVIAAQPAEVPLPVEYAGRVVGFRDVEVRSPVGGILKRGYEDGARITQGQLLFQIDPAPYQVALHRAEAQLQQAQASLRQAEENFERIEELFRRRVATDKQRDEALAARDQARASVQLASAEIENAKLNLGHTEIAAPITGVTSLQSPPIAVPFAVFGAIAAIYLRGIENDIYFQVGLVTLIGLAAKNAILIVEVAAERHRQGLSVHEAAVEAARLRFRPIVMTSLAFILGVVPLALATGASSASRHSIGTSVIGGMLAATFFATLFVPMFFRLVTRERRPTAAEIERPPPLAAGEATSGARTGADRINP